MPLRQMLRTSSVLRASLGYCLKYKTILRLFRDKNVFFMIFYKGHIKNYHFYEIFIKKLFKDFFGRIFFQRIPSHKPWISYNFFRNFDGRYYGLCRKIHQLIQAYPRQKYFFYRNICKASFEETRVFFSSNFHVFPYQYLTILNIFSKHFLHGSLGIFSMCSYFFTEYPLEDS